MLNNESAAILEVLEQGGLSLAELATELAEDSGAGAGALIPILDAHCRHLVDAGFLQPISGTALDL